MRTVSEKLEFLKGWVFQVKRAKEYYLHEDEKDNIENCDELIRIINRRIEKLERLVEDGQGNVEYHKVRALMFDNVFNSGFKHNIYKRMFAKL